jgi:hypothetical protein
VNLVVVALVEPSSSMPQVEADSVVREVVIRQPVGNVGVEPDAVVVRKSAGATVRSLLLLVI